MFEFAAEKADLQLNFLYIFTENMEYIPDEAGIKEIFLHKSHVEAEFLYFFYFRCSVVVDVFFFEKVTSTKQNIQNIFLTQKGVHSLVKLENSAGYD